MLHLLIRKIAQPTAFALLLLVAVWGPACSPSSNNATDPGQDEQSFCQQARAVRDGQSDQIRLDHALLADVDLELLVGLEDKLRRFNCSRGEITDRGLERIGQMSNLEQFRLASPRITDAGLEHLAQLKQLRFLHLLDMPITDAGLAHLHGLTNLESLYLDHTQVTDDGIAELLAALPEVHLHLDDHHHRLDRHAADHEH